MTLQCSKRRRPIALPESRWPPPVRYGYLIMEVGAEQEVRDVMGRTGDYEQSHGTPDQRYAAYEKGFQNADIELCLGQR